jgi:hypothetical protein
MKNAFLVLVLAAVVFAGCKKDDSNPVTTDTPKDVIVGTWVSTGANIAPLLYAAPFKVRTISATFNNDGSYTIVQTDSAGTKSTLTGTYVTAAGGAASPKDSIRTIVATQMTPTAVTAEGIYQVTPGTSTTMKYEVVQTQPAIGVAKPTAALGFGSTAAGAYGTWLIQKYVKQ